MNKGLSTFRNYMRDATDNKSFGSVLADINEVCKRIVYMTYKIIIFFFRWLYYIVYDV